MYSTNAIYFDGFSSKPQEIELIYNEKENNLIFIDSNFESHKWQITSCNVFIKPHILRIETKEEFIREIKVENTDFIYHFNRLFQEGNITFYEKLMRMNFLKWIMFLILVFVTLISLYFVILPTMSDTLSSLIPEKVDKEIGDNYLNSFLIQNEVDTIKTFYLKNYLKEFNVKNKNKIDVYIIKSNEVNAFALPNGSVIVYTELLNKLNNHNQLNALLGHEISHINNRHTIRTMCKNLFSYLWVSLIFSDVSQIQSILLQNAYTLQSLSFSREFEKEADLESIKLMRNNGLPLNGIIELLEILTLENKNSIPQFLSTHPVGDKRIQYNKDEIYKNKNYKINKIKDEKLKLIWLKLKQ